MKIIYRIRNIRTKYEMSTLRNYPEARPNKYSYGKSDCWQPEYYSNNTNTAPGPKKQQIVGSIVFNSPYYSHQPQSQSYINYSPYINYSSSPVQKCSDGKCGGGSSRY